MNNIEPAVDNTAQYYLQELGIKNPEMLLTNNASECLNSQIAEFRHQKGLEAPKDLSEQIVEFKNFDDQKCRDVTKAFYGQGPYRLKEEYRERFEQPVGNMPSIEIPTRDEIVLAVRQMETTSVDPMVGESPAKALQKNSQTDVIMAAKDIKQSQRIKRVEHLGQPVYYSVQDRSGIVHSTSIAKNSCTCWVLFK
jgi:hypothetical protein